MQEIIKEYGPVILTIIAIVGLVVVVKALTGSGTQSVVGKAFTDLINSFVALGSGLIKGTGAVSGS